MSGSRCCHAPGKGYEGRARRTMRWSTGHLVRIGHLSEPNTKAGKQRSGREMRRHIPEDKTCI